MEDKMEIIIQSEGKPYLTDPNGDSSPSASAQIKPSQIHQIPCDPRDCSLPGSSVHGDSPGKKTGVGCHFLLQGSSQAGVEPMSSALQADSLPLRHLASLSQQSVL